MFILLITYLFYLIVYVLITHISLFYHVTVLITVTIYIFVFNLQDTTGLETSPKDFVSCPGERTSMFLVLCGIVHSVNHYFYYKYDFAIVFPW